MATFSANRMIEGELERVINSVLSEIDEFSDSLLEPLFSSNLAYSTILSASDSYLSLRLASGATFSIQGSNLLADDLSSVATRIEVSSTDSYFRMDGRLYPNYPEPTGTLDSFEATEGGNTYSASGDFSFDSGELIGKNSTETYVLGSINVVVNGDSTGGVSSLSVRTPDGLVIEATGDWDRDAIYSFSGLFAGNDRFLGTSADDFFFSTQGGDDVFVGSSGIDTLRLIGSKSTYSIGGSGSGEQILTNTVTRQKFTLDSIEQVQFDDQLFSFDSPVNTVPPVQVAPSSGGATAYLAQFGLTVDFARQFIIDNLGTPQYIYATALLFGITNDYFSEILNVPKAAVVGYWGALGLDANALEGAEIIGTVTYSVSHTVIL
jgi:hypothetical protein